MSPTSSLGGGSNPEEEEEEEKEEENTKEDLHEQDLFVFNDTIEGPRAPVTITGHPTGASLPLICVLILNSQN
jgi:hypothetical protein